MAIVCARPLLSWQCPKGHFQDYRLSPSAQARFIHSGLPLFLRYWFTPHRRLLTLREDLIKSYFSGISMPTVFPVVPDHHTSVYFLTLQR